MVNGDQEKGEERGRKKKRMAANVWCSAGCEREGQGGLGCAERDGGEKEKWAIGERENGFRPKK